jgi:hypothetical protein
MLEFKLFGIRNPEAKKRYQAFITKTITSDDETRLNAILDPKTKGKTPANAPSRCR